MALSEWRARLGGSDAAASEEPTPEEPAPERPTRDEATAPGEAPAAAGGATTPRRASDARATEPTRARTGGAAASRSGSATTNRTTNRSSDPGGRTPAAAIDSSPRLGEWLRERRETRGLDLSRVERDTRISRRYIEAIEADQLELLPAPVYARGFVRNYARYLGLDEQEARTRMPRDLPRPRGLEPLPGMRRREGAPAIPAIEHRWLAFGGALAVLALAAVVFGIPGLGSDGDDSGSAAGESAATGPSGAAAGAPAPDAVPAFEAGRAPDFRGVERSVAETLLAELGLSALVIEVATADTAAGRVFAQTPQAGAELAPGDDVTLIVSSGPGETDE